MRNQMARKFVDETTASLKPKAWRVDGFAFTEDVPNTLPLYSRTQSVELGFWNAKQPRINGFTYVSEEYEVYVNEQG